MASLWPPSPFSPRDVILSDAIGHLNEDLAIAVSKALQKDPKDCREYALNYSWDKCARLFESHLEPFGTRVSQ